MLSNRLRVGVVFGGRSGEHEVSLASARSMMRAMDPNRFEIVPIGITHSGQWLTSGDAMAQLSGAATGAGPLETWQAEHIVSGQPEEARQRTSGVGRELVPGATGARFPHLDVIVPVLHGPYGEDGTIQGLLELAGIPYVGCGVLSSALAMDKIASKQLFAAAGLPIPRFVPVLRKEWEANPGSVIASLESTLGYPVFAKPANLGSSIGINKATNREQLRSALDDAAQYDRRLLVEEAIPAAREVECSVLGNDDPVASVPGEVVPSNEFYDYDAKYIDGRSQLLIPAPIPAQVAATVRQMALRAFKAIDGAGLARVDFLMDRSTGAVYINEINTMPGFTDISMYAKLWEATDLPYPELIDRLIDLALERHVDKARSRTTYAGAMAV